MDALVVLVVLLAGDDELPWADDPLPLSALGEPEDALIELALHALDELALEVLDDVVEEDEAVEELDDAGIALAEDGGDEVELVEAAAWGWSSCSFLHQHRAEKLGHNELKR